MNDTANPIYIALLFILRCLVPLFVLFGISYLLRRLGLVVIDSPEPENDELEDSEDTDDSSSSDDKEL